MSLRSVLVCCLLLVIQSTASSQPWKPAITYRGAFIFADSVTATDGMSYYEMQIDPGVPWERNRYMIHVRDFPWDTVRATGDVYPLAVYSWIRPFNADGRGGPDLLGPIDRTGLYALYLGATKLRVSMVSFDSHFGIELNNFQAVEDVDQDGIDDLLAILRVGDIDHLEIFWGRADQPWPTRSIWILPQAASLVASRSIAWIGYLDARLHILAETRFNTGDTIPGRYELYRFDPGDVREHRDTLGSITVDTLRATLASRWTAARSWRIMDSLAWWFAPSTDVTSTDWLKVTSEELSVTQPHPSFPPLARYDASTKRIQALTQSTYKPIVVSGPSNDLRFSQGPREICRSSSAFLIGTFAYTNGTVDGDTLLDLQYFRIKDGQTLESDKPVRLDLDDLPYSYAEAQHIADADGDLLPELVISSTESFAGSNMVTQVYLSTGRTTLSVEPRPDVYRPELKKVHGGWILLHADRDRIPESVPVYDLQGRICGSLPVRRSEPVFIHDPEWSIQQPCWGIVQGVSFPILRSR